LEKKVNSGVLLVAEPHLIDDSFNRSLVLLCEHSNEGSVGFIVNKPMHIPINEALSDFPTFDAELYYGGPVQKDSVYFLHTLGDKISNSIHIWDNIYWGGNLQDLKQEVIDGNVNSKQVRFLLGYSGWSSGQLDEELQEKSWIPLKSPSFALLHTKAKDLWKKALLEFGNTYKIWLNTPEDPSLN
jgi:putative transcriptional regulator